MKKLILKGSVSLLLACSIRGIGFAEMKITQELEAGVQGVKQNNPEAKFEEYREVPNGVVIEKYSITGEGEKSDYSLEANKISQEDQSASFSYNRGKLKLDAGYDQTPHNWSNITKTLYDQSTPGVFLLPDGMQATIKSALGTVAFSTSQAATDKWFDVMNSTFIGFAHSENLGTRQDKTSANLGYAFSEALSFDVGFFQEKKEGKKLHAFALGRNHAIELAKPIDQMVYDVNAGFQFQGKGMNAGLKYGLSLYDNEVQTLIWDNTKQTVDKNGNSGSQQIGDASKQGQATSQPDNLAHTVSLAAGMDLPVHSRVDADIAYTRMLQNEDLLPYTINSALSTTTVVGNTPFNASDPTILPSKAAETDQTLIVQNYSLKNRIFKPLGLEFRVRSEQLGNDSKEIEFEGHAYIDQIWQNRNTNAADTHRIAFRKLTVGANADYDFLHSLRMGFDFTRESALREHREYRETEEDIISTKLSYRPFTWLSFNGKYKNSNRKAMEFELSDYIAKNGTYLELPGMRRSDIASRMRNAGELTAQFWRGPVSASLNGALGYDKYKSGDGPLSDPTKPVSASNQEKMYGLLEGRNARAGLDVSFELSDLAGLFAYYQYEQVRGTQRANQSGSGGANQDAPFDYTVVSNDRYDVVGLGADFDVTRRWKLMAGYDLAYSRGATDFKDLGSSNASKSSPPETVSSKQDYSLKANCAVKTNFSVELGYLFELYNVKDFATDNVPLLAGKSANQTNIFLGDSIMDYKAHVASVKMNYKW